MDNCIFVILVFSKLEVNNGFPDFGAERLVGYYFTKKDAFDSVINNVCDIWETCYTYALIEAVKPGLYEPASKSERWFFKYNRVINKYEPIDEPDDLEHIVGFTIG